MVAFSLKFRSKYISNYTKWLRTDQVAFYIKINLFLAYKNVTIAFSVKFRSKHISNHAKWLRTGQVAFYSGCRDHFEAIFTVPVLVDGKNVNILFNLKIFINSNI